MGNVSANTESAKIRYRQRELIMEGEEEDSDFYCRNCNLPVRVRCRIHEFAMSSYRYLPLSVFEMIQ